MRSIAAMSGVGLACLVAMTAGCSSPKVESKLDKIRKELGSSLERDRKLAARDLVGLCCPRTDHGRPPVVRSLEAPTACVALGDLLRTSQESAVIEHALLTGFPPACIEEVPVDAVLAALALPSPKTRYMAVLVLWDYEPTPRVVEALIAELRRDQGTHSIDVHSYVEGVLADLGEPQLERVVEVLHRDPSVTARRGAAATLAKATLDPVDLPWLDALISVALADPDEAIRFQARSVLYHLEDQAEAGPAAGITALVAKTNNNPSAIRRLGRRRLSCGSPAAAAKLEELTGSPDEMERFIAKRAIATRTEMCRAGNLPPPPANRAGVPAGSGAIDALDVD